MNLRNIIFSGTSGSGKSTFIKKFLEEFPEYNLSVSYTTRKPRNNEIDEKDYYFIKKDDFLKKIKNDEFIEYVKFNGNYYGPPKSEISKNNKVFDVDRRGVIFIKKFHERYPNNGSPLFIYIYIEIEELKKRLIDRQIRENNFNMEEIENRIKTYNDDMELYKSGAYDIGIKNDNFEEAYEKLKDYILNKNSDSYLIYSDMHKLLRIFKTKCY